MRSRGDNQRLIVSVDNGFCWMRVRFGVVIVGVNFLFRFGLVFFDFWFGGGGGCAWWRNVYAYVHVFKKKKLVIIGSKCNCLRKLNDQNTLLSVPAVNHRTKCKRSSSIFGCAPYPITSYAKICTAAPPKRSTIEKLHLFPRE